MKKIMIVVLVAAVLLVATGIIGNFLSNDNVRYRFSNNRTEYYGRGMMQYAYLENTLDTEEKLDIELLEENVEKYINQYDENLVISDIFLFEESEYYFSIMEEDTGMGAMELLVNQYTGDVYPEYGPNMMWNLKYGMHNNSGYGMMRGSGMMSRSSSYYSYATFDGNEISNSDAQKIAAEFVYKNFSNEYVVSEKGHEFYGYYTFHIEDNDETIGMLSVNGFTGEVWYHSWHGTVTEVIDGHDENDEH